MSDIIDKNPPPKEVMTGPIYLLGIPTQYIDHVENDGQLGSSSLPFTCFTFEHTGRVIGYRDSANSCVYLLGNEKIEFKRINSTSYSMWCGFNGSNINNITVPPSGWSEGYAQESNTWRIGMIAGTGYNVIPPLAPINFDWNNAIYDYNDNIHSYLQSYKQSGSEYQLSTTPERSIRFKSFKDKQGSWASVFNENLLIYSNALNQIIGLAKGAYGKVKVDHGRWVMYMEGGGPFDNYRNMVASNLLITTNLEQAKRYVEDGTLPDDYIYDDPTKPPSGSDDKEDSNNGGEGDSGSDHREDIEPKQPAETAMTLSNVNLYALEKSQLQAFINDICSVSWAEVSINTLTGIYNNLTDSIQSIRVYPFAVSDLGTTTIVDRIICGFFEHTANVNALTSDISIKTAGSYDLKEVFGGWADYAPYTDIDLYLPYIGYTRLDTNLFMKHSITVKYTIDVLCGVITYFVLCDKTTILIKSAKICADVPISLASGIDTFTDVTKNVASFGGNLASKRPVGMLTGSSEVQTPEMVSNATESGIFYMPTKCAIKIVRPSYTRAKNYDSRFGYPCYGAYKLSNLTGFTVVENYKSHYTKGIKKEEEDMIKNMIESGVYL